MHPITSTIRKTRILVCTCCKACRALYDTGYRCIHVVLQDITPPSEIPCPARCFSMLAMKRPVPVGILVVFMLGICIHWKDAIERIYLSLLLRTSTVSGIIFFVLTKIRKYEILYVLLYTRTRQVQAVDQFSVIDVPLGGCCLPGCFRVLNLYHLAAAFAWLHAGRGLLLHYSILLVACFCAS